MSHKGHKHSLKGVYQYYLGKKEGLDIWVVDGIFIRREVLSEFLYGGNDQVYDFIPKGEIWVDGSTDVTEAQYTILHEIVERNLMVEKKMSYDEAHKIATEKEGKMRDEMEELVVKKEKKSPHVYFAMSDDREQSNESPLE